MTLRIWPLLLLVACAEPQRVPTEFEQRCESLLREVLPDVHAVLGDSVGRPVRVLEGDPSFDRLAWVPDDEPGVIRVDRAAIEQRGNSDRELSLLLVREVAKVYQSVRHPWMRLRRLNWDSKRWTWMAAWTPTVGHTIWLSDQVARRRGWEPFRPLEGVEFRKARQDPWFKKSWFYRLIEVGMLGRADPNRDGPGFVEFCVRRKGHAGALRHLRTKTKLTHSEILWPEEPDPKEMRERLRSIWAAHCREVEVNRVHPRVLDLLAGDRVGLAERGWQIEASDLYEEFRSAELFLFPTSDAASLMRAAREVNDRLKGSADVAALEMSDGVARSIVTSGLGPRYTETWMHEDGWLAVMIAPEMHGGAEWCRSWIRKSIRVLQGKEPAPTRWDSIWESVRSLKEDDRPAALRKYWDDESESIRALVFGLGPPADEEEYCARVRRDPSRLVRIAVGHHFSNLIYDPSERSETRALVESLLHDPDPFVRAGVIGYGHPEANKAGWDRYWRFVLTDPLPALRGEALEELWMPGYLPAKEVRRQWLTAPIPGRQTVEAAIRPLVEHALYDWTALEFLVRMGSTDETLWKRLVELARAEDPRFLDDDDIADLLCACPLPGNRREALKTLHDDEKLRPAVLLAMPDIDE